MFAYNPFARLSWLIRGSADGTTLMLSLIVYGAVAAALWL